MKLNPENICIRFPKKSAEVIRIFVECKSYINKYALDNNLTSKDISNIALDIISAEKFYKHEHSSNIHKTLANKLCSLSDDTRPHGEYLFNSLEEILGRSSRISIARNCIHQMLLEYYIPNLSYNNWKAYLTN